MRRLAFAFILLLPITLCAYEKPYTFIKSEWRAQDMLNLNYTFDDLYNRKQDIAFTVLTSTPVLTDLSDGQIMYHSDTGVYHLYIRNGDDLIQFNGTKIN
jgi:hypothetical protein